LSVDQAEYMTAVAGSRDNWQPCPSFFTCGTALASDVGAEPLTGKRDLDAAKALIRAAGYAGQKIVILDPSDYPQVHAESLVTAELLRRLGLNVEVQTTDWGTVLARRTSKEPVDKGGWSIFHTSSLGPDMINPALNSQLRGNGLQGWFGWPTDLKLEALRDQWLEATDPEAQKRLAGDIQRQAFETVPYVPLGQFNRPTAYRKTVTGVLPGPAPFLWNLDKP
jgi:peptide/nickel transport system substrate-binding protein